MRLQRLVTGALLVWLAWAGFVSAASGSLSRFVLGSCVAWAIVWSVMAQAPSRTSRSEVAGSGTALGIALVTGVSVAGHAPHLLWVAAGAFGAAFAVSLLAKKVDPRR